MVQTRSALKLQQEAAAAAAALTTALAAPKTKKKTKTKGRGEVEAVITTVSRSATDSRRRKLPKTKLLDEIMMTPGAPARNPRPLQRASQRKALGPYVPRGGPRAPLASVAEGSGNGDSSNSNSSIGTGTGGSRSSSNDSLFDRPLSARSSMNSEWNKSWPGISPDLIEPTNSNDSDPDSSDDSDEDEDEDEDDAMVTSSTSSPARPLSRAHAAQWIINNTDKSKRLVPVNDNDPSVRDVHEKQRKEEEEMRNRVFRREYALLQEEKRRKEAKLLPPRIREDDDAMMMDSTTTSGTGGMPQNRPRGKPLGPNGTELILDHSLVGLENAGSVSRAPANAVAGPSRRRYRAPERFPSPNDLIWEVMPKEDYAARYMN